MIGTILKASTESLGKLKDHVVSATKYLAMWFLYYDVEHDRRAAVAAKQWENVRSKREDVRSKQIKNAKDALDLFNSLPKELQESYLPVVLQNLVSPPSDQNKTLPAVGSEPGKVLPERPENPK